MFALKSAQLHTEDRQWAGPLNIEDGETATSTMQGDAKRGGWDILRLSDRGVRNECPLLESRLTIWWRGGEGEEDRRG